MSFEEGRGPAEFQPVKIGPRRRRFDPVALGVVLVAVALGLAVLKPWDGGPGVAAVPSSSPVAASVPSEAASPAPSALAARDPFTLPTWSDVVSVISRQTDWGIRTIVVGAAADPATPTSTLGYVERWFPAGVHGGDDLTSIVDEPTGSVVALGVTFPPTETPLDVRVWLERAGGEIEWVDTRPVSDVPARGAYLFLRRGDDGAAIQPWAAGRYRMDVLAGGTIRRIDVLIRDATGRVPDPEPWPSPDRTPGPFESGMLAGHPTGLFVQTVSDVKAIPSEPGPKLDELQAWLDVDTAARVEGPQSFVARTFEPDIVQVGVVLPEYSTVRNASVKRLAPYDATGTIRWTGIASLSAVSYVAFGLAHGAIWRPGVYAITVSWEDSVGPHESTWHLELRPGLIPATPLLLAATRSWAPFVGSHGVLLGVTEPLTGTDPLGVSLVDIVPHTKPGYPGLSGDDLIGCGETHVQGRPEVIGIVGTGDHVLAPVAARILYPFDQGPLDILTAAGSVPGLTLIAPSMTAEFDGPASYGFRAGTGQDAPGYTICIGLPAGG